MTARGCSPSRRGDADCSAYSMSFQAISSSKKKNPAVVTLQRHPTQKGRISLPLSDTSMSILLDSVPSRHIIIACNSGPCFCILFHHSERPCKHLPVPTRVPVTLLFAISKMYSTARTTCHTFILRRGLRLGTNNRLAWRMTSHQSILQKISGRAM